MCGLCFVKFGEWFELVFIRAYVCISLLYICVCMHACVSMYACMCVCVHMCIHVHACIYAFVYGILAMYAWICSCTLSMHVCWHQSTHKAYIQIYPHAHIYTYIHPHAYTPTQTKTNSMTIICTCANESYVYIQACTYESRVPRHIPIPKRILIHKYGYQTCQCAKNCNGNLKSVSCRQLVPNSRENLNRNQNIRGRQKVRFRREIMTE
jgi:hypothetical protein